MQTISIIEKKLKKEHLSCGLEIVDVVDGSDVSVVALFMCKHAVCHNPGMHTTNKHKA